MNLLVATNNPGKRLEIQALLADIPGLRLLTPSEIGLQMDVQEDGGTYLANATLKAKAFASRSGLLALADDSGLEVEALHGDPGVHSARFSPYPGATDADRRMLLLEKLAVFPRPWMARFCCVVVLAHPSGIITSAEGFCSGQIIPQERGQNGFGYDPIFLVSGLDKTMAELDLNEKNQLSHRARAVRAARPIILQWLSSSA
ncbi:MAG: RdgB/HAM1 family non-canonical purine NTP pyrophosphatase [Anaerolineales bacterium]|jgi:XTP/dITP diphosphohydrolase|nr:RdgB/HAM1 family non-canonical purine NTP pyrophosphatase [Anaerolineales bacterium]